MSNDYTILTDGWHHTNAFHPDTFHFPNTITTNWTPNWSTNVGPDDYWIVKPNEISIDLGEMPSVIGTGIMPISTLPNEEPKIEVYPKISHYDLKEDEIIMLTFDTDIWSLSQCKEILEMWKTNFPNHKVVGTVKGVEISFLKDENYSKSEVSW